MKLQKKKKLKLNAVIEILENKEKKIKNVIDCSLEGINICCVLAIYMLFNLLICYQIFYYIFYQ